MIIRFSDSLFSEHWDSVCTCESVSRHWKSTRVWFLISQASCRVQNKPPFQLKTLKHISKIFYKHKHAFFTLACGLFIRTSTIYLSLCEIFRKILREHALLICVYIIWYLRRKKKIETMFRLFILENVLRILCGSVYVECALSSNRHHVRLMQVQVRNLISFYFL